MNMRNVQGGDSLGDKNDTDEESNENRHLDGTVPVEMKWITEEILVNNAKQAKQEGAEHNKATEIAKHK